MNVWGTTAAVSANRASLRFNPRRQPTQQTTQITKLGRVECLGHQPRLERGSLQGGCPPACRSRIGVPDDVAAAVGWLASPEAGFVNGEVLHVNGGWVFGR